MGAISLVSVSRAVCRVAKADAPSSDPVPSQKRRRDRRTYQFERSSMKPPIRRPAVEESKDSIAAVTSRTSECSSLSSQRSSSGLEAGAGVGADPNPASALAYMTRNDAVFQ